MHAWTKRKGGRATSNQKVIYVAKRKTTADSVNYTVAGTFFASNLEEAANTCMSMLSQPTNYEIITDQECAIIQFLDPLNTTTYVVEESVLQP
jgi:hypothetical protein